MSMPIPPICPKNSIAVTSEPSLDHTEPCETKTTPASSFKSHADLTTYIQLVSWQI